MRRTSWWLRLTWGLMAAVPSGALLVQLVVGDTPDLGSGAVADQVRDLLSFCLLCGVSAFATIETIKRLTSVRGRIQLEVVREWLMARWLTTRRLTPSRPTMLADPAKHLWTSSATPSELADHRRAIVTSQP